MKCPVDDEVLQMSERQGVEVDYCPRCRGVWLDRGELDKVIERASTELAGAARPGERDEPRYQRDDRGESSDRRPPRKKRSFLSEIFEGD